MNTLVENFLLKTCKNCPRTDGHCSSGCQFYRKEGLNLAYHNIEDTYKVTSVYANNSALQTAKILNEVNGIDDFTNLIVMSVVKACGGNLRSLKDAVNLDAVKVKKVQTNIERYGAVNPLSKGTTAFEKRNNTVKEKYGCDNVFQNDKIKQKIKETTFEHFGCYSQASPSVHEKTKRTMLEKYGCWSYHQKDGVQKNAECQKGNRHRITKPDITVQEFLRSRNISFEIEKTFYNKDIHRWAQVDILVGNVAFEIQGTFWHADPRFYLDTDIVYHGKTADDIWKRDKDRKDFLQDTFNLKVIYLWQYDIENDFNMIENAITEAINACRKDSINTTDS